MLKRLYVDNYKALVNFELSTSPFHLWLGRNGSGKTTCAELLAAVQQFARGTLARQCFPVGSRNLWLKKSRQVVELEVDLGGQVHTYNLQLDESEGNTFVAAEKLTSNGQVVFQRSGGDFSVWRNDHLEEVDFQFNPGLSIFQYFEWNSRGLTDDFRSWLDGICYVRLVPPLGSSAVAEVARPSRNFDNFGHWLRRLFQEDPNTYPNVLLRLREVVDGLVGLRVKKFDSGEREIYAAFRADGVEGELPFSSLSDGQQVLCALYLLLPWAIRRGALLILDEPDNFVALRELQPWLSYLEDQREEGGAQIFLISHHPEFLNQLAVDHGVLFRRLDSGWVKAEPFSYGGQELITPAELIARGWEHA